MGETDYYDPNKTVDHEFLKEQKSLVRLIWVWKSAEHTGGTSIEDSCAMLLYVQCFDSRQFWPETAHNDHTGHEGSKDLGEYIKRSLADRKALPDGEANGDRRIEVLSMFVSLLNSL